MDLPSLLKALQKGNNPAASELRTGNSYLQTPGEN
jgi:hypothetical protein